MPNQTKPSSAPNTSARRSPSPEEEARPATKVRQPRPAPQPPEPLRPYPREQGETDSPRLMARPYVETTQRRTQQPDRPVAQPYQGRGKQNDYRTQMRRFVDDSPVGWFHMLSHRVALVIHPLFAATVFLVNLLLQVAWEIVQLGARFMPADSQRRLRRMGGPMLHEDSPAAMIVFASLLLLAVGGATKPFLLPEPAEPRSFEYSSRPAWQRIADPSRAINFLESAVGALTGAGDTPQSTAPLTTQPLGQRTPGDHTIQGAPSISPEQIDRILQSYGSPAVGTGQAWYDLGLKYDIDPAYAVAFFIHESSAGTNPGWAGWKDYGSRASTHNVGNIICAGYPTCYGRFRDYPSWEAGIDDWYRLIAVEYIQGRGTVTVAQIIPIYAPSFENDVDAYVNAVEGLVDTWRTQGVP